MNKGEIKTETLELVGDNIVSETIPSESLEDAIVWAQDELARRLGVTYEESDPISVAGSGIVPLPDSLIKPVRIFWVPDTIPVPIAITIPEYAYSGQFNLSASIPPQSSATTIVWSANNAEIDGPTNGYSVLFDIGQSIGLATLTVTAIDINGGIAANSASVKVIPYTSSISYSTGTIPPGSYELVEVELGWSYEMVDATLSAPGWVRIYNDLIAMNYDLMRPIDMDPAVGTQIVWEGIFTEQLLHITEAPDVRGVNGDVPRDKRAYVVVWNTNVQAVAYTGSFTRTETHTSGVF